MKRAGEILKSSRTSQNLSIQDIVKATKMPEEFIKAIEEDEYQNLPDGVYAELYIKKYAEFLNLSSEKLAAVFRRDYQRDKDSAGFSFQKLNFFSKWQSYIAVGILVAAFLGYLVYQYFNFVRPPKVKITDKEFSSQGWVIKGRTHSGSTLTIDGQIVNFDEKGRFIYTADRQSNQIKIIVRSPAGRTKEITKKLDANYP
jgi:cytoskeletal protein RodZ